MRRLVGGLATLAVVVPLHAGRQEVRGIQDLPAFDVSSVKENRSGSRQLSSSVLPRAYVATNTTLHELIGRAHGIDNRIRQFVLIGGPDRLLSARFDIYATSSEEAPPDQILLMLRRLLIERFSLRTHVETRQLPVYALTMIREGHFGPALRPSSHNCNTWLAARRRGEDPEEPTDAGKEPLCVVDMFMKTAMRLRRAAEIDDLVKDIQSFGTMDRLVLNRTGLVGNFEWTVTFAPTWMRSSDAPSLFTALQEQLGLKLEPRVAPVHVLVIDSVEMPTPN